MQATHSLIYFPKQSKPSPTPPKKKIARKCTAMEWIRNGYQFPGKPAPVTGGRPFPTEDEHRFDGWSDFCKLAACSLCRDESCKCGCHEVSRNVRKLLADFEGGTR
jgi:hypothetical protein